MEKHRPGPVYPGRLLFLLLAGASLALGTKPRPDPGTGVIAVLDPVDLRKEKGDPVLGSLLRQKLASRKGWQVASPDTLRKRLVDYKSQAGVNCREFQCAFDVGNILPAEFILFGSVAEVGRTQVYNFSLLHVPAARLIWYRAGEAPVDSGLNPNASLETALKQMADGLRPTVAREMRPALGQLTAVVGSSKDKSCERILSERIRTHLYGTKSYEPMGGKELEELLRALGVKKDTMLFEPASLDSLAPKLGLKSVLYFRLNPAKSPYALRLSLVDLTTGKVVRDTLSGDQEDFKSVLRFEQDFILDLPDTVVAHNMEPVSPAHKSRMLQTISLVAAGVGLGMLGFWVAGQ